MVRPLLAGSGRPGIYGMSEVVGLDGLWQQTFGYIPSSSPVCGLRN